MKSWRNPQALPHLQLDLIIWIYSAQKNTVDHPILSKTLIEKTIENQAMYKACSKMHGTNYISLKYLR